MRRSGPGKVAFPVIIAIGGITGVLSYMLFSQAAPGPLFTPAKFFEPEPFSGPPSGEIKGEGGETGGATTTAGAEQKAGANAAKKNQTAAILPNAVIISILEGASVQGNPSFDPDTAEASINQNVAWKNEDSTAHTATSDLFDSSIINPGDSYSIAAKKIGAGEHSYSCTIHPYMKGKIVIK